MSQKRYCPKCGMATEYEINLPKSCKCGLIFANAFKTKSTKTVAQVIDDSNEEYELIRVKKLDKIDRKKIAKADIGKSTAELEAEDFSDEDYDTDSKESLAREIRASLNENDIIVNYGADASEKLGQFLPKK